MFVLFWPIRLHASQDTIGANGINSAGLGLTGNGIAIGQVEPARPGDMGVDMPMMRNSSVDPTAVFRRDGMPNVADTANHAEQVAGIMISTDAVATGVATGASLYSSAYVTQGIAGYNDAILTMQHIATRNGGDVRTINHSWGKPLAPGALLDGNSQPTLALDWSAHVHDVLHVVAGNESTTSPVPTDNFNGVTVAASAKVGGIGAYRQVAFFNTFDEDAEGDRTSIDLLAPGHDVRSTFLNDMLTPPVPNAVTTDDGTSFAAPHVTATVALLQEHAENEIMSIGGPQWTPNSRRHEVMKAVLMNSADKIIDDGTFTIPGATEPAPAGTFLGMTRTVLDQGDGNWLASNAYTNDTIPLDIQIGAGHLNARRALQQFNPGEHGPNGPAVPMVGWDYGSTIEADDINRYALGGPLDAGQFVSITLAWDREVLFDIDGGTSNAYDIGDTFIEDLPFNDLDLYLMPAGSVDLSSPIAARSIAGGTTVEHIFFEIATAGSYEIWVHQFSSALGFGQDYALAWWTQAIAAVAQGDYDGNGTVGPEDYLAWKSAYGSTVTPGTGADGNGDGIVDAADYTVWRNNLQTSGGGGLAGDIPMQVPEPSVFAMLALVAAALMVQRLR